LFLLLFALPMQLHGASVHLPVRSETHAPFVCTNTEVATEHGELETFQGKVRLVHYGLVPRENAGLEGRGLACPEEDELGSLLEGTVPARYSYYSGNPGYFSLDPLELEVPEGYALWFVLEYETWTGDCTTGTPYHLVLGLRTRPFFVETR